MASQVASRRARRIELEIYRWTLTNGLSIAMSFAVIAMSFVVNMTQMSPSSPSTCMVAADEHGRFGPPATPFAFADGEDSLRIEEWLTSSCSPGLNSPCAPPLHVHLQQNETFRVLSGVLLWRIGDEEGLSHPGDTITVPAGVPHTFSRSFEMNKDANLHLQSWLEPNLGGLGGREYFMELAGFLMDFDSMTPIYRSIQGTYLACTHSIHHCDWNWPFLRCKLVQALAPFLGLQPRQCSEYATIHRARPIESSV